MVKCVFCGVVKSREDAIRDGWEPYFWDYSGDVCYDSPVCPQCSVYLTRIDGEASLQKGVEVPVEATPPEIIIFEGHLTFIPIGKG